MSGESWKRIVQGGRSLVRRAGDRVREPLQRAADSAIEATRQAPLAEAGPEPPVVARLVVEIRSDGSRTIARGGLEDLTTGQKVAVRADGTSPAQLARSLASTLVTLPVFAARIARSLKKMKASEGARASALHPVSISSSVLRTKRPSALVFEIDRGC
ncbi:MAG: hypothetical protein QM756_09545 [Polyangiaceae bacterium]